MLDRLNDPVIIIGAGRSGTNALRDALCSLDTFVTWPCDEINYIWRYGNRAYSSDELMPEHATRRAKNRIWREFRRLQARSGSERAIVEKTCANTLRVGFVAEVFPCAKFVHIVRDGRAVAASAMKRWKAPIDPLYLAKKARFVPVQDLPYYATRYLGTRIAKISTGNGQLSWWGPKFGETEELRNSEKSLVEVCATQWRVCVQTALDQLGLIADNRVIQIRYEDFVSEPRDIIEATICLAGKSATKGEIDSAAKTVRSSSRDAWRVQLSSDDLATIRPIVSPLLERLGYIT